MSIDPRSYNELVALRNKASAMVDALQGLLHADLPLCDLTHVEQARRNLLTAAVHLSDASDHVHAELRAEAPATKVDPITMGQLTPATGVDPGDVVPNEYYARAVDLGIDSKPWPRSLHLKDTHTPLDFKCVVGEAALYASLDETVKLTVFTY